ncbi:hypothetical protein E2C01_030921 [Portunus trituberculatus]|uniref:Uncharacterized protein n=1 Tax=Portunus trituberculatus TaxID=210409 RepID=A0A5B7ET50_PORTR|nr:hypothetical protein [Portunus trituberculatus]
MSQSGAKDIISSVVSYPLPPTYLPPYLLPFPPWGKEGMCGQVYKHWISGSVSLLPNLNTFAQVCQDLSRLNVCSE